MRAAKAGWAVILKHCLLKSCLIATLITLTLVWSAPNLLAQKASNGSVPMAGLGSKGPVKIDADRLDVFDNEKRAVFTGNVIAVQGDTTIHCSALNVFYEQSATAVSGQGTAAIEENGSNDIRKLDCKGPVTVVSQDQTATGQHAIFDRASNIVTLTGDVALSQGNNIQQCDKVIYNLNTSVANCIARPGGRVKGVFVPGSSNDIKKK